MKRAATVVKGALAAPALAWWCAGLGVLLAAPSLLGGIQMDDHYLRMVVKGAPGLPDLGISRLDVFTFAGNDAAKNAVRIDAGLVPWWTSANARIRFFRPLSALTHYLDFRMLDGQWWLMHLQSLLWYGALCGAAAAAYRRVIPSVWVAGLAAVFFAADDAHGLPVGWLANRNALLTGIAGVLTLVSHDYWRRGDCRRDVPVAYFRFLGPAMMAVGLLCGEAAIGAAGYVAAYALFLDPGTKRERFLSLLPYGLVAGVYLFFYALAGFGIQHSGIYAAPLEQPASFVLHVVEHLPVLLHAQLGLVSANPYVLMPPRVQQVQVLLGAAVIAASFAVFLPMLRRNAVARFWALGMVLAALPVGLTLPSDRLLVLPGLGGMGLVAVFIGDVAERYALDLNGLRHKVDRGVAVLLAVIHGVVAPLSLPFSSLSVVLPGRILEINLHRLNLGSDLRQKSVLFINAPYDVFGASLLTMLSAEAMAAPRHLWALTAGTGPVTVKRTAVDGLEVTCEEGCFSYPFGVTFYDVSEPLKVGDSVETADFTVTVTALTAAGWPETLQFVFKKDLESPDFDWYCIRELRLAPFPVPAVGESAFLPGTDALDMLRLLLKEAVP